MNFWQRFKYLFTGKEALQETSADPVPKKTRKAKDEEPYAELAYVDKKLVVKKYNSAFVAKLKNELGDLTDGKSDAEIVQLYVDRENIEREDPKLEVLHLGLQPDGTVKMQLDWNRAFIHHLRENGIVAETEEAAVELYLQLLHKKLEDEEGVLPENVDAAFADLDAELHREFEEAREQIESQRKEPKQRRRRTNRVAPPDSNISI